VKTVRSRRFANNGNGAGIAGLAASEATLANLAKRNISQLTALVKTQLRRMQYRPGLLDGFLAETRLDFKPFRNPAIEDR
jgi:hypothetical protein